MSRAACLQVEEIFTTRKIWGHQTDAGVLDILKMDPAWPTDQAMAALRQLILGGVTMAQVMHLAAPHPWAYSPWARAVVAYQIIRDDTTVSLTQLATAMADGAMALPNSNAVYEIASQTLHPKGGGYPERVEETP